MSTDADVIVIGAGPGGLSCGAYLTAVGKRVIVVANLAPRKMVGLESQGMLLMAEDRQGALHMLTADSEPGSTVS